MAEYLSEEDMNTGEYISRDDVLKAMQYRCKTCDNGNGVMCRACDTADAMDIICDTPAADVQPVKRGHWIEVTPKHSKCSNCDVTCLIAVYPISAGANFCPNCGSDNRGDSP